MNILIISETFKYGGLETQIIGQVNTLKKKGYKFFLMVGNKYENEIFEDVNTQIDFSSSQTCASMCEQIDKIICYIKQHKIDYVHAHPFNSAFFGAIAASKAQVPVIYTAHGPASISNYSDAQLNMKKIILKYGFDLILTVGEYLTVQLKNSKSLVKTLPNCVDLTIFKETKIPNNMKWAFVSRLDCMKEQVLYVILPFLKNSRIKKLDIYGDGPAFDRIKQFISNNKFDSFVELKGSTNNLSQDLLNNYDGLFGMGRCALESMAMNMPTIIASYTGICGAIDKENITGYSELNFSGRGSRTIDETQFNNLIDEIYNNTSKYQLREIIEQEFNEEKIWLEYDLLLKQNEYTAKEKIEDLYLILKSIDTDEYFANNQELMIKLIELYPEIPTDSANFKLLSMINQNMSVRNETIQALENKLKMSEEKIQSLETKVSLQIDSYNKLYYSTRYRFISKLIKIIAFWKK